MILLDLPHERRLQFEEPTDIVASIAESLSAAPDDAIAAALIRTGIGGQFGRLNVGSAANNIYASDLALRGVGFAQTTVPEPSNVAVLRAIIAVAAGKRRKRPVSRRWKK